MRVLIELFHIAAGIVAALVIAALSAWAVPRAADTIWFIDYVAIAVIVVMGIQPLRGAWRADQAGKQGANGQ
ncbi:MAG: hypothetical protein B7Y45_09950 [Sphingomonas sp. 28-66-16]|nr:MAG: hypothetical protein B7Y45_09950 [Sphingomonas sp. 28-66-16]